LQLYAIGVKAAAGFFQFGVFLGIAEAEEVFSAASAEEGRASDGGYAGIGEELAGFLLGGFAGDSGGIGEDVVSAVGDRGCEASAGEGSADEVALGLVFEGHVGVEAGGKLQESGGCSVLERCGGADVGEVVEVADGGKPLGASGEVAETPAGNREGLGEAGDGDGAFGHAGERGDAEVFRAFVEEVLVHLVGEDEEVVLDGEGGEEFELGEGEDLARGVRGRVEDDGAGARGDGGTEAVEVEGPVGCVKWDGDRGNALRAEGEEVVAVEGLEDEALVAGVEERLEGAVHSAGSAGGDEYLAFWVGGDVVEGGELLRDGFAEAGDAVEACVDVMAIADSADGGLDDGVRWIGVADALGHVDAVDGSAGDVHGANLRLDEGRRELA